MKIKFLTIILLFLIVITGCGKQQSSSSAVLYLNDEGITEEEYAMLVKEYCNYISMQYTTEKANSEDFWEMEINGQIPYIQLADLILDELKYNYSLKQLAVQTGVEEKYSYNDLLSRMQKENDERSTQIEDDEVIYGITDFDISSYYKYWYSNLETRVKSEWIKKEATITENDCKEYYDAHKVEDYSYDVGVTVLYAEVPYESEETENRKNKALFLKRVMEQSEDVEQISEMFPEAFIEKLDLNSIDTQEGASGIYRTRWEIASVLEKDEVYGPYEDYMGYCVIRCINRVENGVISFDIAKNQIERYLQVEQANLYIENMKQTMEVKINEEQIKKVILETIKN